MPKYKLIYFDVKVIGEPIRYLLNYGGIEYDEQKIPLDEWDQYKKNTPYGKLPILVIEDGKRLHQSVAICRFLGKKIGLAGNSVWENLQIDMTVDTFTDLRLQLFDYGHTPEGEEKEKKFEVIKNELLPFHMSRYDEQVKQNGGYFVGGKLTWADFYFIGFFDCMVQYVKIDIFAKYPNLQALKEKVQTLPSIKEFIEKRWP